MSRARFVDGRGRVPSDARGFGVVEGLTGLLLTVLLLQLGWGLLRVHVRAITELVDRAESADAGATVHGLLRQDLRGGLRERDSGPAAGDSISLRAFRGVALPCDTGASRGDGLTVLFRGTRTPDPEKDSLLVLDRRGRWRRAGLRARRTHVGPAPGLCPAVSSGTVERWRLSSGAGDAVLLRLFERGSYHLTGGALRYRRGQGGRQPLTGVVLDDLASALDGGAGPVVRVRLGFRTGAGRAPLESWPGAIRGRISR